MIGKLLLAGASVVSLLSPALADGTEAQTKALTVATCGAQTFPLTVGGQASYAPLTILQNGTLCTVAGGSGGSSTSNTVAPTAAGTSATTANPVQGVTGGVPLAVTWAGQTVQLGAGTATIGSVSVSNFPTTQAVSGTVSVSNFPATQPVSGTVTANAGTGTFTVGGTVAVSNFPATQAVSGTVTANLGTLNGAATAANQNSTAAGTSATNAQGVQGVTGGVAVATNQMQVAGTALGAPTAYGTPPSGNVPGMNVFQTNPTPSAFYQTLSNSTPLAANASFNSGLIQSGSAAGLNPNPYAYFTVLFYSDQPGTFYVTYTVDSANFYPLNGAAGTAYTAGTSASFKTPLPGQFIRVVFTNGSTAQTKFAFSYLYSGS